MREMLGQVRCITRRVLWRRLNEKCCEFYRVAKTRNYVEDIPPSGETWNSVKYARHILIPGIFGSPIVYPHMHLQNLAIKTRQGIKCTWQQPRCKQIQPWLSWQLRSTNRLLPCCWRKIHKHSGNTFLEIWFCFKKIDLQFENHVEHSIRAVCFQ